MHRSNELKVTKHHLGKWKLGQRNFDLEKYYQNDDKDTIYSDQTFTQTMQGFAELRKAVKKKDFDFRDTNTGQIKEYFSVDHSDFAGGTMKELFETKSCIEFNKLQSKVKRDIVKTYSMGEANKRKRRFSEHDGNWEESRQWEVKPFESVGKELSPNPLIDIDIHMCFSGGVKARTITKYGTLCAAIINHLESIGYLTSVNLISVANESCNKARYKVNKIRLKGPNEYSSVQKMLTAFSPNYYRRVMFSHTVLGAELLDDDVSYGLGYPYKFHKDYEIKNGKIEIFSTSVLNNQEKFIEDIKKGLKIA